ncbi:S8 family peptidase [Calothrix rhizosoleniae]|uniref:S8 family peptidase n=1 Tax=Calothrix rhizosoleniae TaxID=888997 RepID=UPI000B499CB5|nr:S8 family peptidase [Calothrix rhizosoleniae]
MSNSYNTSHPLDRGGLTINSFSSVNELTSQKDDGLQLTSYSSSSSEVGTDEILSAGYDNNSGYGLIDAGKAVGKAIGEDSFTDVPDEGGNDWGADMVEAPEVWERGHTGKGVIVAVLDTGVDYDHLDLNDNIWRNTKEIAGNGIDDDGNGYIDDVYGWNFSGNDNDVLDRNGHGTHVAGTIAGENNDFGVTGIAYDAQIMPVKVLDDSGSGSYSSVADGIYYAVDNGAQVINLSLGGSRSSIQLKLAIEYANSKGITVVMAAGNNSDSEPGYPGRYADEFGIVVGAVDSDNQMANFSNRAGDDNLAYVTAPGVDIYSTVPNNRYDSYSGTSMATPHVAGVVALMLSANPNLTTTEIRQIITETSGNNTQTTATTSWDFSSYLSSSTTDSLHSSTISGQNFDVSNIQRTNQKLSAISDVFSSNSTVNAQEWNYEQNLNQAGDKQFSASGNNDNDYNDWASIIEGIAKQLEPYQQWLDFFF